MVVPEDAVEAGVTRMEDGVIIREPDGAVYVARAIGDGSMRAYREGRRDSWDVKVQYDMGEAEDAYVRCGDIADALEEAYGTALDVNLPDFSEQVQEKQTIRDIEGDKRSTSKVDRYRVTDDDTALTFHRYDRPVAKRRYREMGGAKSWWAGWSPRLLFTGGAGAEMAFDVIPQLPAEGQIAAGTFLGLWFGEPILNAWKPSIPTPGKALAGWVADRHENRYTTANGDFLDRLDTKFRVETGDDRSRESYRAWEKIDGDAVGEMWETVKDLDFEDIETRQGVTVATHADTYLDALEFVSAVTGIEPELTDAERPLAQDARLETA